MDRSNHFPSATAGLALKSVSSSSLFCVSASPLPVMSSAKVPFWRGRRAARVAQTLYEKRLSRFRVEATSDLTLVDTQNAAFRKHRGWPLRKFRCGKSVKPRETSLVFANQAKKRTGKSPHDSWMAMSTTRQWHTPGSLVGASCSFRNTCRRIPPRPMNHPGLTGHGAVLTSVLRLLTLSRG